MSLKEILAYNKLKIDLNQALVFSLITQKGKIIYKDKKVTEKTKLNVSPGLYHLEVMVGHYLYYQNKVFIN